jgi:hypothetical protein
MTYRLDTAGQRRLDRYFDKVRSAVALYADKRRACGRDEYRNGIAQRSASRTGYGRRKAEHFRISRRALARS